MHMAILLGLNGHIYPIPDTICAVLQSRPDNTTRILDIGKLILSTTQKLPNYTIGCGTGLWYLSSSDLQNPVTIV